MPTSTTRVEPSAPPARSTLACVMIVTALGGFLFGYDTAVINGANQYFRQYFGLTPTQEGLAGASAILGCIPGAMCAGILSDRLGRRRVLIVCALLYAVSGLLCALPRTFTGFLLARTLSGLGIGASSMVCPVYVAELAPATRRGRLGSLFQVGIVVGIFLTLFVNAGIQSLGDTVWNVAYGWRWMLGAEVLPALLLLAFLGFAPESPRWLIQSGRTEEAQAILRQTIGPDQANVELEAIQDAAGHETSGTLLDLLDRRLRRPLALAVVLMAVSQLSGINAVMYYSTRIFVAAGVGVTNAFSASVAIGLVNLVFTFVALAFIDRAGRRPLLLAGMSIQVLALGATAWMFHANQGGLPLLGSILVFIASFAMALGPVPWIVCAEIFPDRVRGRAMSLATFVIWTTCYLVAQTFPLAIESPRVGPARTFAIYGVFSVLGLLYVAARMPETRHRTLEEIERAWQA